MWQKWTLLSDNLNLNTSGTFIMCKGWIVHEYHDDNLQAYQVFFPSSLHTFIMFIEDTIKKMNWIVPLSDYITFPS